MKQVVLILHDNGTLEVKAAVTSRDDWLLACQMVAEGQKALLHNQPQGAILLPRGVRTPLPLPNGN